MSLTKKVAKKKVTVKYPFVLKDSYISVTLDGKPFALQSTHPTFTKLKNALKNKRWEKIPGLVSIARSIANQSYGQIEIRNDKVFFRGAEVHNAIADRMVELINQSKPFEHMLKFMDNLYKNPSKIAIQEFYGWLVKNDLPFTDDGGFLAYKSVKKDNTDTHSGTIDNSPGQVIMMPRREGDEDWRNQCSSGFHICSKQYGVYGEKTMAVKVNPKDVLSAVAGKMRVVKYEVLMELGAKQEDLFKIEGFDQLEKKLVVEVRKEREEMIQKLLKTPEIKRKIAKKKLNRASLYKTSYARLKAMVQRLGLIPKVGPEDPFYLKNARKAAGLTSGQIAKQLKIPLRAAMMIEQDEAPVQEIADNFIEAIAKLTGTSKRGTHAVTYPKATGAVA